MELIRDFHTLGGADLPLVGGKGANLGVLTGAGLPVPPGFCLTVSAFTQFIAGGSQMDGFFARLAVLTGEDVTAVRTLGEALRTYLGQLPFPAPVAVAVEAAWRRHGRDQFYAVRSSATAEDLPTASFAGQQDTFLHIHGLPALLDSIQNCWISLFTDRAILYRIENGFDHAQVALAVVVQQMVQPQVAGTLFTVDPVSGHRGRVAIDAGFGLGEALVSGLVTPDSFLVDKASLTIREMQISDKKMAIWPLPSGGTRQERLSAKQRRARTLLDHQVRRLARLALQAEALYDTPQDIEWALADGRFYFLQARPVTTLFPVPQPNPFSGCRVYVSLGHAQVMTAPVTPAGISLWRALLPFGRPDRFAGENPYIQQAGGRIYIDISPMLYTKIGRRVLPRIFTAADMLLADGLAVWGERPEHAEWQAATADKARLGSVLGWLLPLAAQSQRRLWLLPPRAALPTLRVHAKQIVDKMAALQAEPDPARRLATNYRFLQGLFAREVMFFVPFIMTAMMAKVLLERLLAGRGTLADIAALQSGLVGNVTTEMDLMLADLADLARGETAVRDTIRTGTPESILHRLQSDPASEPFLAAFAEFLTRYGMRGPGEIDLGKPRWGDDPTALLMMIRGQLASVESGGHRRHFAVQTAAAAQAAGRLIAAAGIGRGGWWRKRLVRRLIAVFHAHMPLREDPKYLFVRVFQPVRRNVQELAQRWTAAGELAAAADIWYLTLPEMLAFAGGDRAGMREIVAGRRADYARYDNMRPPRLLTSAGERIDGRYHRTDLPEGAFAGSGVSPGVVTGPARVIHHPAEEVLAPGEILVAPHTDPAWTPLFINAAGLVLEVGGLMTHGSVVAREYGIPAVVSVPEATERIRTGQRVLVDGERGFVQILE
jgi:phosphohistidine swiveling domain-containing protein